MSKRNRWLAAIIGGVVVVALIAGVAITLQRGAEQEPATPGHWRASDRTAFINSCVEKCRASPGVTPAKYPACDRACSCAADEGEKIMSFTELVAIERDNGTAAQNEKVKRMTQAALDCAK
jgi:hypothetical protein